MKKSTLQNAAPIGLFLLQLFSFHFLNAQTLAFPEADVFLQYAQGVRTNTTQQVYIVADLNDVGTGSFRDGVSKRAELSF